MNWKEKMWYLQLKIKKLVNKNLQLGEKSFGFFFHDQAQRKYELELENRRSFERNLEELQRLLDNERQMKNQMGVTNREWTEKISNLERQVLNFLFFSSYFLILLFNLVK